MEFFEALQQQPELLQLGHNMSQVAQVAPNGDCLHLFTIFNRTYPKADICMKYMLKHIETISSESFQFSFSR